ncbi:MAG: glycoside hydrolase family 43 protein [Anaerolineae bacterium]
MSSQTHRLPDVRIRDPHILADAATHTYYLASSLRHAEGHPYGGVEVRTSRDLVNWEAPVAAYSVPEEGWGREGVWAPDMHLYRGWYYLFLTHNSREPLPGVQPGTTLGPGYPPLVRRGSQVLLSSSPLGPFRHFHNRPHLPVSMMTLDGTLWLEDGVPYMVYCHEWVQTRDGTVEMVRLKDDLSDVAGAPRLLFRGSEAPWGTGSRQQAGAYVTDGPSLYRTHTGHLLMIWSSFVSGVYATGVAHSESDTLAGPWRQQTEPLFIEDGGHGTIFRRFDGQPMLVLHQPNRVPDEHAWLFELEDTGDTVRISRPFP